MNDNKLQKSQNYVFYLLFALISAVLILIIWGIPQNQFHSFVELSVKATGDKNAFAQGARITIRGAEVDGLMYPAQEIFDGNWKANDDGSLQWEPWGMENVSPQISGTIPAGYVQKILVTGDYWSGKFVVNYGESKTALYDNYRFWVGSEEYISIFGSVESTNIQKCVLIFSVSFFFLFFVCLTTNSIFSFRKELKSNARIRITKAAFLLSCTLLSVLLALYDDNSLYIILTGAFSFLFYSLVFLYRSNPFFKVNLFTTLATVLFSAIFVCYLLINRWTILLNLFCHVSSDLLRAVCASSIILFCIPAIVLLTHWAILFMSDLIDHFKSTLDKSEKLYFIVCGSILFFINFSIYSSTSAFSEGYYKLADGTVNRQWADIVYGYDHSWLLSSYDELGPHLFNIRHPFIRVFTIFPAAVSRLFQLIFENQFPQAYGFSWALISSLLMMICAILLKRITKDAWIMPIYSVTFFFLIMCFGAEQYQISIFFILLTVYSYTENINCFQKSSMLFMSGMTLTSGYLVPFLIPFKKTSSYILNIIKYSLTFVGVVIASGSLRTLSFENVSKPFQSMPEVQLSFFDKIVNYTNFITYNFISPTSSIQQSSTGNPIFTGLQAAHFNLLGVIILFFALLSFWMNRKDKVAQLSFINIVFSFILCSVLGWAANEPWLYAILFSWGYLVLLWKLIAKFVVKKDFRTIIYCLIFCGLILINAEQIHRLFNFCVENYSILKA